VNTGPNAGNGRNIDPERGLLEGEAAGQAVPEDRTSTEGSQSYAVWERPSSGDGRDPTYYDRPVLKQPTWIWAVPVYFYLGGAAGAAAVLGTAAQAADRRELHGLVTRSRWIAASGGAVGTALLIYDLGRPARFANMLRVFRPSSPMNVGSWILTLMAPLAAGSAVLSEAGGLLGATGDAAGLGAGLLGGPLAGYTAVLISNTAVPVWQATRRSTPPAFIASAMAAAAGLLQLMRLTDREHRIVRRFAIAGSVAELAAERVMERDAGVVERVAAPLHQGRSGAILRAAKALSGASLALNLLPGRSRAKSWAAGLTGTLGSLAFKYGVFEAGKASAADPRATFHQQRAGHGAAEVTGRPAVSAP
jgi:formate-dependent nitrite reductase membrane component NrfD